ncbi:MAG TPA: hypothetical protein VKB93_00245 [Thermoanaerobaculia bacterium]|nr:hypothetical protein [Thermoanaerobaculia bacterium]
MPFLLLLAFPAAAQIAIQPAAPKAGEPVTITINSSWADSCVPELERVYMPERDTIIATYRIRMNVCLAVVSPFPSTISLPGLPPGEYRVETRLAEPDGVKPLLKNPIAFTVAENPALRLAGLVSPSMGGTSGGLIVGIPCPVASCAGAKVLFGGIESPRVEAIQGGLRAMVPPASGTAGAPGVIGLVDVIVRVGSDEWKRPGGFQYVSPIEYETILLPSLTNSVISGAFGSRWKIEHHVYNGNAITLRAPADYMHYVDLCPILCGDLSQIHAGTYTPVPTFFGISPPPPNWILHVRREVADALAFSMRVRDLTKQGDDWGAEIPVVRSHDFKLKIQLVDVPLQARFRQTLRVFALPQGLTCCGPATVRFYSATGALLFETPAQLQPMPHAIGGFETPSLGSPDFPVQPEGFELDALGGIPELAGNESVRIEITTPSLRRLWAYVAVTNNATQHVTIVSPH